MKGTIFSASGKNRSDRGNDALREAREEVEALREQVAALQSELVQREPFLKQVEDISRMGHWSLDISSGDMTWSDGLYRILGCSPEDTSPSSEALLQAVHPDDRPNAEFLFKKLLETGGERNFVHRLLNREGKARVVDCHLRVVTDSSGQPLRIIGTLADVSDRESAKILANQAMLQGFLDAIPIAINVKDSNGRFIFTNQAAAELLEIEIGEFAGKEIADIFGYSEKLQQKLLEADRQVIAEGCAVDIPHVDYTSPSGKHVVHRMIKFPWRDTNGNVTAVVSLGVDITERVQAERELQSSQRLLQAVFDTIPHALAVKDTEDRFIMANQSMADLFGISAADMAGKIAGNLFWPSKELKLTMLAEDRRVIDNHEVMVFPEAHFVMPGGRKIIQHKIKLPLLDENGEVAGLVVLSEDVTESKQAEQELRSSQRLLQTVFDAIPDMLMVKDNRGRYTMMNKAALDYYRIDGAEFIGKTITDLPFAAESRQERHKAEDAELLRHGRSLIEGIFDEVSPDGQERTIRYRKFPLLDDEGGISGLVGLFQDITEVRRREEELRQSEARFQGIFENATTGIIATDLEANILMANPAMSRMTGYTRDELTEMDIDALTLPRDVHIRRGPFESILSGKSPNTVYEKRYETKDGNTVWVRVMLHVLRDAQGVPEFAFGIIEDITQEHQLRRSLRESQKLEAVGKLAGTVARDFDSLLQIVFKSTQELLKDLPLDSGRRTALEAVVRAASQGDVLAKRLSSAITDDNFNAVGTNVREECLRIADRLSGELDEGISLQWQLDEELGRSRLDITMFYQIMKNLCSNAQDAMPEGGAITIAGEKFRPNPAFYDLHPSLALGKYARISISDTGKGMSDEVRERLFEPFFTTRDRPDRLGLGLAMVYGAMNRHGGAVELDSEEGRGTTISLYFPLESGLLLDEGGHPPRMRLAPRCPPFFS